MVSVQASDGTLANRESAMAAPIVYLFRGTTAWHVSLRGIPEDTDLGPGGPADPLTAVPTPLPGCGRRVIVNAKITPS
jgi:hypothetical protein